jgi:N-acetylneuraminate synthase
MQPKPDPVLEIESRKIGEGHRTYFIADIAANHDGDLGRAIHLIHLAAKAGANAAKFQHFQAESIVSDRGFKALGAQQSHQSRWKKSVFEVYKDASVDLGWTVHLKDACAKAGIAFFTSPYALDLVDAVDPYVPAYKIGSGDITWLEIIEHIASKQKPCILATGASMAEDVVRAVSAVLAVNPRLALLQCNTNYTASLENFRFIQLNVLKTYRQLYPEMVLGLSDHTPGHATVLGAVALGARIVEKHFTDDTTRVGPDHGFSMDPRAWREMVDRTRELENSLGTGLKKIEDNEQETSVLQRRSIRLRASRPRGSVLQRADLTMLRPCPVDAMAPWEVARVLGRKLTRDLNAGDPVRWIDLE